MTDRRPSQPGTISPSQAELNKLTDQLIEKLKTVYRPGNPGRHL
jgi:hypothetical protein